MRLTRDVCASALLIALCIVGFVATTYIREPSYASVSARLWPRFTLVLLLAIVLIYFAQSLAQSRRSDGEPVTGRQRPGLWLRHGNAIISFVLFFVFLLLLPVLGMLLDGIAFVFLMQTVLGAPGPRAAARHALIAVITVGAMWAVFTYWLGVIMPAGMVIYLG